MECELRKSESLRANFLTLYGLHFANILLPMITLPYLTRVLGPAEFGVVGFVQACGGYISLVVEFGFGLAAMREVARWRNDKERLGRILAGVIGAKCLLGLLALIFIFALRFSVPMLRGRSEMVWAGAFWAIGQGATLAWFFVGLEGMGTVARIEIAVKAASTAVVFLAVRNPSHSFRLLIIQGTGCFVAMTLTLLAASRRVPLRLPTVPDVLQAFRTGSSMFLFRSAASFYTLGNTVILGFYAPVLNVAYYSGAERIVRAMLGLLGPANQALFPRLAHLVKVDKPRAAQLTNKSAVAIAGLAGLTALMVSVIAPFCVRMALGPGFEKSASDLRILILLLPIVALSNTYGIRWMLPLNLDRQFNVIIISAGFLNALVAFLIAPRYADLGMAYTVVGSELFVTIAIFIFLKLKGLSPIAVAHGAASTAVFKD
jgi:PST family polysaccharide transporter